MQTITGHLAKMKVSHDEIVNYYLRLDKAEVHLNPYLGREIVLQFDNIIHCTACGKKLKKAYQQGYCFPCTKTLAECDICIVKPELCHYDQGTCRQPEWGMAHCMRPHVVYLANSSGLKVGITRKVNVPTRWIDQGAIAALPILEVATRHQSGMFEMLFKDHMADKTNWRKMLSGDVTDIDLIARRDELLETTAADIADLQDRLEPNAVAVLEDAPVYHFNYPVQTYPTKIKSHNFDKNPCVSGVLEGVKGQYLILSTGVINIRKFSGYQVSFSA